MRIHHLAIPVSDAGTLIGPTAGDRLHAQVLVRLFELGRRWRPAAEANGGIEGNYLLGTHRHASAFPLFQVLRIG